MLSLCELERAVAILSARLAGHRLQGVVQPDDRSVVLELYGRAPGDAAGSRCHVLFSCREGSARLALLPEAPPGTGAPPPAFAQLLRARLPGARVTGLRGVDGDRQAALGLDAPDGAHELLLQIFGRRSNVYLLREGRVAGALRPLRETRSELRTGEPWRSPESGPPRTGEDRFADVPDEDFFAAVEAHYRAAERDSEADARRRRIAQALRKEARRLDRKLEKLAAELAQAREASRLEREGELLKSVLGSVSRGDTRVVARDFATGEEVAIELDPTLSPAGNLDRIFKRYQKALRRLTRAGAQEEAVRISRAEVAALEEELAGIGGDGPDEADDLAAFARRPGVASLLERAAPPPPPQRPDRPARERKLGNRTLPARLAPRRYATAGGLEIWVGRSDEGNDHLSTRLARGKDLFFHVASSPGSHVVLRTEGRPDPPSDAVLDACELAVHFSKQKNATRADVHVVPIANVRKPRGAKRGLVSVHGGKVVHLRRTPQRLERLLAARIE